MRAYNTPFTSGDLRDIATFLEKFYEFADHFDNENGVPVGIRKIEVVDDVIDGDGTNVVGYLEYKDEWWGFTFADPDTIELSPEQVRDLGLPPTRPAFASGGYVAPLHTFNEKGLLSQVNTSNSSKPGI